MVEGTHFPMKLLSNIQKRCFWGMLDLALKNTRLQSNTLAYFAGAPMAKKKTVSCHWDLSQLDNRAQVSLVVLEQWLVDADEDEAGAVPAVPRRPLRPVRPAVKI
jgi:hypothetical protein